MTLNLKDPIYNDESYARQHLEALQWPHGPVCPHCGVVNEATQLQGKSTRPGVWKCRPCQKPFSVTVGTVFERSKIPLTKWLLATELLTSSKKGISAHQVHRMLGVTYKTAWFMMHRIREAMTPAASEPPLGGYGKIVEADETYIGKVSGKRKRAKEGGYRTKMKVLSLVERGGNVRSKRIKDGTKLEIVDIIRANVDPASVLHTDGAGFYTNTGAVRIHEAVDHNKEYVRPGKAGRKVHTNTLEGFFSVFKRGMVGTYQHCGEQHLDRYLAEFDFRANTRSALGIDDGTRAMKVLEGINGKRLTYRRPHQA
jgi:transposase-like protein